MIQEVPEQFRPRINTIYPPNNNTEFERWVYETYSKCETDRIYLPIFWTGYYVNHSYGQDKEAINRLQSFIDSLDKSKKFWTVVQYDDSILNDVSGLDILRFEMSKKNGVDIPLMCEPHPYVFDTPKKYLASFVGSRTHPIRNELEQLKGLSEFYISFEPHSAEEYCRVLHESIFSFCPRGYGLNSFRILESLQYGAIPIYRSDDFIEPFSTPFYQIGLKTNPEGESFYTFVSRLLSIGDYHTKQYQDKLPYWFKKFYTYEGCLIHIIENIETEYNCRSVRENIQSIG